MNGVIDLPNCVIMFLMFSPFLFFLFVWPTCFVMIWWVWETCYTAEYNECKRPVIPCRPFSDVESFLFFFILCTGPSVYKYITRIFTFSVNKFLCDIVCIRERIFGFSQLLFSSKDWIYFELLARHIWTIHICVYFV